MKDIALATVSALIMGQLGCIIQSNFDFIDFSLIRICFDVP